MTAYIFVLAVYSKSEEMISFHHNVVMADSPEDAYNEGARKAEKAGLIPVADGELANDYVIKLVED